MLIKFTNAVDLLKGNPIYINSDWIVTAYEEPTDGGSLRTVIYGGPSGIPWYVEESLSEVVKLTKA